MGLRESRIINSVHPWLGVRLQWLQDVAKAVGGGQSLISGIRTREEQLNLYNRQTTRPAAFPGCSQHEFGFAADAVWTPITQVSSKGKPRVFTPQQTNSFMGSAARHVGLTLVANDTGHLQMYNGLQFKAWSVDRGFCDPNPPPPRGREVPRTRGRIDDICGLGFATMRCGLLGCTCEDPQQRR